MNRKIVLVCLVLISSLCTSTPPTLYIKIPTRSRPQKFFNTLDKHYELLSGSIPYHFLISCDIDDPTMNNPEIIEQLKKYPNLSFSFCPNKSKVEAYNRDVHCDLTFDILLVSSDDMVPCCQSYDLIIAETMLEAFPDFDGILNFHDGVVGAPLNTFPIIGKKFFDRFGYIYYPGYVSLFCDQELTMISRMLNKEKISDITLMRHMHPVHGLAEWDQLYMFNESLDPQDRKLFHERKGHNFHLDTHEPKETLTLN